MRGLLVGILLLWGLQAPTALAQDWIRLDGCTLDQKAWKDGDSFHVKHQGKNYIFRLYFVDCPEEDRRFPARNTEQAAYFGLAVADAQEVGKEAADYSAALLGKRPFTVWTVWQDALGASRQKRFYAMVAVDGRYLSTLLVENGLARIYGKRITLPSGESSVEYRDILARAERSAKAKKLGAWSY